MTKIFRLLAAVLLTSAIVADPVGAADPAATTITVPEMECASCAKKLVAKLMEVSGVEKAEFDVQSRIVKVTPKAGAKPSPKAMWDAVGKGGKDPSKIDGPGGNSPNGRPVEGYSERAAFTWRPYRTRDFRGLNAATHRTRGNRYAVFTLTVSCFST